MIRCCKLAKFFVNPKCWKYLKILRDQDLSRSTAHDIHFEKLIKYVIYRQELVRFSNQEVLCWVGLRAL